jgi:hypothetical protein
MSVTSVMIATKPPISKPFVDNDECDASMVAPKARNGLGSVVCTEGVEVPSVRPWWARWFGAKVPGKCECGTDEGIADREEKGLHDDEERGASVATPGSARCGGACRTPHRTPRRTPRRAHWW